MSRFALLLALCLAGLPARAEEPAPAPGYVGDETCLGCHEAMHPELLKRYDATIHARVLNKTNAQTPLAGTPHGLLARLLDGEEIIAYGPHEADQRRFARALRRRLHRRA